MSSTQFKADLRDLEFCLFEQVRIQDFEHENYKDFDEDLYRMVLAEAAKLAEETLAPLNAPGDEQGCGFEDGKVTSPVGYTAAYQSYVQAGWTGTALPQSEGGQGLPVSLALATVETFTSACPAFVMYPGLTVAATRLIQNFGTPWMREVIVPKLLSGEWAGTMCLTEPQAGTAIGDLRTRAERDGDAYRLRGNKIFITGGEQDLTENIIHLVLAQSPNSPPGIKGLGLFLVPKMLFDEQGNITGPNEVVCSGIEHKMGMNGSATCQLSYGDGEGSKGWIIGEEGGGIIPMFTMMNDARIGVGVQGYAIAAAAYSYALSYAQDRVQGTRLSEMRDFEAERVAIVEHPDVRRMLLSMRAQVEGMRAFGLTLGKYGNLYHLDPEGSEAQEYQAILEVL
ncbi:MAG: acyl-CoA dehydrogenase family protein, partial [Myxococcota bacterium]|nr:acyl-CoA dehydrogenase family protein [Myxococcota bacterium]